jgi:cytochrome c-type biogenesis protein CcmF
VTTLRPGKRIYFQRNSRETKETAIHSTWAGDLYLAATRLRPEGQVDIAGKKISPGNACDSGATTRVCQALLDKAVENGASIGIHAYYKPLVGFLWLGGLIMFFGGALSLSDRRLRLGAPMRRAQAIAAKESAGGQPA